GKPSSLFLGGHYEDTYVKTAQGWRIDSRRLFPPRSGTQQPTNAPPASNPTSAASTSANTTSKSGADALSPDDRVEIQQLVTRTAYALDTAVDHGDGYAQLFTPDGVFASKTTRPVEIKGRAQLAAFAAGDLTHRGPAYVREYLTNTIVQPSKSGATGRIY